MTQYNQEKAEREFTRPWSERRGIETIYRNGAVILVKAPLDNLSEVLEKRAIEVRRDVFGSEIEVSGVFMFASQLVGHPWSILLHDQVIEPNRFATSVPDAAQLSKELRQSVIILVVNDTSYVIRYRLFEDGELVEYFDGEQAEIAEVTNQYGLKTQRYVLSPYAGDSTKQTVQFWSRHRQVTAKKIGNMWNFVEQFLIEQDAFDPGIDSRYLLGSAYRLKRGVRYRVQNPGVVLVLPDGRKVTSVPDLVRVDYFRFGN